MHDSGRQFGCYGAPGAHSPEIDKMAAEGIRFANHFSTGTVCVPSRASILTGRYLHNAETCFYNHSIKTLPRILKDAGYATSRLGFAEEKEYRGIAGSEYPGGADVSGVKLLGYDRSWTESALASDVVDEAIRQIERADTPTYLALAFTEAHSPYSLPVGEKEIAEAALPPLLPQLPNVRPAHEMMARFNKLVTRADTAVGRLLDYLRESGRESETLLYFSCDHGMDLPRAKQTCYDSGIAVPLIFWGGALPRRGAVAEGLSSHADIVPTFCELCSQPVPEKCAGVSQLAQLEGAAEPRSRCISEVSIDGPVAPVRAIRTKSYKFIMNFNPGWPVPSAHTFTHVVGAELISKIYCAPRPAEELYDLRADPCELDNLAEKPELSAVRAELKAALLADIAKDGDEVLTADSPRYARFKAADECGRWLKTADGLTLLDKERK